MSVKNINKIVGDLVEIALNNSVADLEVAFRRELSTFVPFCYSCGDLGVKHVVCNKCVTKHLGKASSSSEGEES